MKIFYLGATTGFIFGLGVMWIGQVNQSQLVVGHDHADADSQQHQAHEQTEVPTDTDIPAVAIMATPDTKSGYNVAVYTENFTFKPESVNGEVVPNTGHAHIYINDHKIARVYGDWFHLDGELFGPGDNTIKVTLNANDHSEWALNGETIAGSALVNFNK